MHVNIIEGIKFNYTIINAIINVYFNIDTRSCTTFLIFTAGQVP